MKTILVRPENVENARVSERLRMIGEANRLVEDYIRRTSFDRDMIIEEVFKKTGIDPSIINWMIL